MSWRVARFLSSLVALVLFCLLVSSSAAQSRLNIYSTNEVLKLLDAYSFERDTDQLHIHHTWDPSYADFNWSNHLQLQEEMRALHVDQNGWDDIGQHLTLFPDGRWMFGRSLNKDPASIRGLNRGALAVEMVGNFDKGHDHMTHLQQDAIYHFSAFVSWKWNLKIRFHRDHPESGKTCPGSGLDRTVFMSGVETYTFLSEKP